MNIFEGCVVILIKVTHLYTSVFSKTSVFCDGGCHGICFLERGVHVHCLLRQHDFSFADEKETSVVKINKKYQQKT